MPEAARSMKGKRKAVFPSLHLDGLLVQVHPCYVRDACHPTIWPRSVRIQGILYASCCPHPRLEQFGSNLHFQLHHLPLPVANDSDVITAGCLPLGLLADSCLCLEFSFHFLLLENSYPEVNSAKKTSWNMGEQRVTFIIFF